LGPRDIGRLQGWKAPEWMKQTEEDVKNITPFMEERPVTRRRSTAISVNDTKNQNITGKQKKFSKRN